MLKNFKPVSLVLLAGMLSYTGQTYAEQAPVKQSTSISQQNGKVTGTVEDDFGPVTGASVVVKGSTNGTITDIDGNFTLEGVKPGVTIQISFIGYATQEIKYAGQSDLKIKLREDTQKLDEVVVTALGMKRSQKALGYAVTELKGDDLKTNSISPVASLQGKVAGVEISQSDGGMFGATKIQIRGASTLGNNNQPIYVVDGVILDNSTSGNTDLNWGANSSDYGNELKNLNPDDFESVSVLKGAAATALYGSRGLNGAVVITTKSGKGSTGFGVSVSQTLGFDHLIATPDVQTEFGYGLWAGERDAYESGNRWDPNSLYVNSNGVATLKGAPYTSYGFGPKFDGRPLENYDGTMTTFNGYENAMREMYQTGFNTNTNVSVRGGNEKTTFYSSISYKKASSTTENNTFERYSLLVKATHKISEFVDVAASVNYTGSKPKNAAREAGLFFVYGNINNSISPAYFRDKYLGDNHGGVASSNYGDTYGYVPGNIKNYNFETDFNEYVRKEYVIRPTIEVNVKMTDWLRFRAEANMNLYTYKDENKVLGSGYENASGGKYSLTNFQKEQFTTAGTFTANKTFGDFNIGGFLRGEYYTKTESYFNLETQGDLIVPNQFFIENGKNTPKSEARIQGTKRMMSAVFSISTSWKNQLFLDITGRNDWSSSLVYTNGTGNYSYFYPSISGSWLINESFKLPEWISLAKVRGSWAQVGNDTNPYDINQGYKLGTIKGNGGNIYTNEFSSNTLYDNNLKPERKNAWEIGLDFRVLNDRIGLDATYYKENTTDQIMSISVPGISGIEAQMVNAGNIQNSGVEIALNTVPYRNKDWEWTLDFTYTKNSNKIIELHPNVANYIALAGQVNAYDFRIGSVARVGGAYGVLMSDITPAKDDNGNTILNWDSYDRAGYAARSNKIEEVGDMNPKFLGSMSTGLTWKNISLRVALDMRIGGMVASYGNRYGASRGMTGTSLAYRDAEHGGMTWTSKWLKKDGSQSESYGITYNDGVIPEGVFAAGTEIEAADGQIHNVGGMSYASLVEKGWLEPMHAGAYHYYRNDWGLGVTNDDWVSELNYIALREITIGYKFNKAIASKIGAKGLGVSFSGRNLGYLYNSLPNNINPESVRGNQTGEFRIRSYSPVTANFMFTVNVDF